MSLCAGAGCGRCPADAVCTTGNYRGSACSAIRSEYGIETDPDAESKAEEWIPVLKQGVGVHEREN